LKAQNFRRNDGKLPSKAQVLGRLFMGAGMADNALTKAWGCRWERGEKII